MATTNFGTLTGDQLQAWSRDFWRVARNASFVNQFAGTGQNAAVQRITELTKSEKGTKANLTVSLVTTRWKATKKPSARMTSPLSWTSCVSQTVSRAELLIRRRSLTSVRLRATCWLTQWLIVSTSWRS
jgi:hypothetical protein